MKDETEEKPSPLGYGFSVEFDEGVSATFQQVEIVNSNIMTVTYRHGNSPVFYPIKMPGLGRVGNVTMREGTFVNHPRLSEWRQKVRAKGVEPKNITVTLIDENGLRIITWTLHKAQPIEIAGKEETRPGDTVAIERVEVAFDRIVASAP